MLLASPPLILFLSLFYIMGIIARTCPTETISGDLNDFSDLLSKTAKELREQTTEILRCNDPVQLAEDRLLAKLESLIKLADSIETHSYAFIQRRKFGN